MQPSSISHFLIPVSERELALNKFFAGRKQQLIFQLIVSSTEQVERFMDSKKLRALQAPLKDIYRKDPDEAVVVLHATGELGKEISCGVNTKAGYAEAGLHPATGGDGTYACSGDMLLEALVACAGVTLKSVATAMSIEIRKGTVKAEGVLDFRGTLGVSRDVPVGFKKIDLLFELDTDADQAKVDKLLELTERYCVVYQTLKNSPDFSVSAERIS